MRNVRELRNVERSQTFARGGFKDRGAADVCSCHPHHPGSAADVPLWWGQWARFLVSAGAIVSNRLSHLEASMVETEGKKSNMGEACFISTGEEE